MVLKDDDVGMDSRKEKKQKKKAYEDWAKEDVRNWVDGIGGSEEWRKKKFFDGGIVGSVLSMVDRNIMGTDMKITFLGKLLRLFESCNNINLLLMRNFNGNRSFFMQ